MRTPLDKLLSHRLRGFDTEEHTLAGLRRCCASTVPFMEIDTRVFQDGTIVLYHDARIPTADGLQAIADIPNPDRIAGEGSPKLLSLDDALATFRELGSKDQTFCMDIKDFGFEREHLELVRRYDLESQAAFVSWIPQSLLRLAELGAKTPLIFSHWNLSRFGLAGAALSFLASPLLLGLGRYVVMGARRCGAPLGHFSHGYQHALTCSALPPSLLGALSGSGGGICVHHSMAGPGLYDYCRANGLELWIFSVNDPAHYRKLAAIDAVDVIFCDDAPAMQHSLLENSPMELSRDE